MSKALAVVVVAGVGFALALPASASAQTGTVVGDAAEAWYATGPLQSCSSPVGCLPASAPQASSYPSGTLHVFG